MDQRIKRSRDQESRGARLHTGRRNAGSGNHWQRKNDMRTDDGKELFEYKRTDGKSITIKATDLATLRRNALLEGRDPRFGIELDGHDYVLLPAGDYELLKERANAATTGLGEG